MCFRHQFLNMLMFTENVLFFVLKLNVNNKIRVRICLKVSEVAGMKLQ